MSVRGRSALVGLGSVAAPVALFMFLKVTIGLGPRSSTAAPDLPPDLPVVSGAWRPPAATPEQERALDWLAAMKLEADLPSPLDHPKPPPLGPSVKTPEAPRAPHPLDGVHVTALLTTGGGSWATINGAVHRVGDEVIAGYRLRTIDARAERIELIDADGGSHWLDRE